MPTNPVTLGGIPVSINYLHRDYTSLREDLITRARDSGLFPEWNNFSPSDPGVGLIELMAHLHDIQAYYVDRWANEAFIRTAVLRKSVIDLVELIGYRMRPPISAQAILQLVYTGVTGPFIRAKGTTFTTAATPSAPAVSFELLEDLSVLANGSYTAAIVHAATINGGVPQVLGVSSGGASQEFVLPDSPLCLLSTGVSTLVVEVEEAALTFVEWVEVQTFANSRPTSRHFRLTISEDDEAAVTFGDGAQGRIPPAGGSVRALYKIGGGVAGNAVPRNSIVVAPLSGLPVGVVETVTNPAQPSGGRDRETIASAKLNAPLQFQTHGDIAEVTMRAITHRDYEAVAVAGGAVAARAQRGRFAFVERVVVAAAGNNPVPSGTWDTPSQSGTGALGSIGSFIVTRAEGGKQIELKKPVAIDMEMSFIVEVSQGFRQSNVLSLVRSELLSRFSSSVLGFAGRVPISRIHQVIENLDGVDFIEDVTVRRKAVIWPIDVLDEGAKATFSAITMSDTALSQVYTLTFLTATKFQVASSVTGAQSQQVVLTAPTVWMSDNNDLQFTATPGTSTNVPGDRYQIRTMPKVGSIVAEDIEILRLQDSDLILQPRGGIPG